MLRLAALVGIVCATAGAAPVPPALVPYSIAFWDAQHGLIGTGGAITRTDDGGRTSRVLVRTAGRVTWLDVAPGGFAWAVAGSRLLRTSDGGRTWRALPHAVVRPSFADGMHGIALSPPCILYARCPGSALLLSSDGGRSWRRRASPCREPQDAVLATPSKGWLLCTSEPGAGEQLKSIYRTIDGGRTWQRRLAVQPRPPWERGGLSIGGYGLGIAFAPSGAGLLWEGRGTLYLTLDGGRQWQGLNAVAQPEVDFGDSASVVPGRAFAVLNRGATLVRLVATTHGYRDWRTVRVWKTGA